MSVVSTPTARAKSSLASRLFLCVWQRKICGLFLLLCFAQHADSLELTFRPDEELAIVDITLKRRTLFAGIMAYQASDGLWLPLTDFIDALAFPIEVKLDEGYAKGWFIRESRQFHLDFQRDTLTLLGIKSAIGEGIELHNFDVYVRLDVLNEWFDLGLIFDPSHLLVEVNPSSPLPIDEKNNRRKEWSKIGHSQLDSTHFSTQPNPFHIIDWPFIDMTLGANKNSEGTSFRGDTLLTGDLLWTTAHFNQSFGNAEETGQGNIWLEKRFDEDSLHPMMIKAGDLFAPEFAGGGANEGSGFSLTNIPDFTPTEFSRLQLDGESLPGWDVELYRNNQLIDVTQVGEDGRFGFDEVALEYGKNRYRLVQYGPQGQQRERIIDRAVGRDWFTPGQWLYRLHWQQDDKHLLYEIDDIDEADGTRAKDRARGYGLLQYGISKALVLRGEWMQLDSFIDGEVLRPAQEYLGLSVLASAAGGLLSIKSLMDIDGGMENSLRWQGNVGQYTSTLEWQKLNHYAAADSRRARHGDRWQARFNGNLATWGRTRLQHSINLRRERIDTSISDNVDYLLSMNSPRWSLSNRLRWQNTQEDNSIEGNLLARLRLRKLSVSSDISYSHKDKTRLDRSTFSLNYKLNRKWSLRTRTALRFDDDKGTQSSYQTSLNARHGQFTLSISAQKEEDWRLGLTLSTSIIKMPQQNRLKWTGGNSADQGAVAFRTFLDNNFNRQYDGDEPLLENVGVTINGRQVRSGQNGIGMMAQLPSYDWSHVEVKDKGLDDPFWLPAKNHLKYMTRPGKVVMVDIPIVESGEIDGTCWLVTRTVGNEQKNDDAEENKDDAEENREGAEKRSPLGRVKVQLFDSNHTLVDETTTSYDGFYIFDRLIPDQYYINLEPTQLQSLGLKALQAVSVVLAGNGEVASGMDFEVTQ
ncbi:MAG: hypothetical protein ACJAYF_003482 [Arenicella sp.]|jgi:hypothetical protein